MGTERQSTENDAPTVGPIVMRDGWLFTPVEAPQSQGLGRMIVDLLAEHWPGCGVNGHYLADLLREQGVYVTPPVKG